MRTDCWREFSWSICDRTETLLVVSRTTVSEVMSAYTNHGETTSAKRNNGGKSTLTERDGRILRKIVSTNHRSTAAQVTAVLNVYLEDPVSTKTTRRQSHNPISTVQLQFQLTR